MRPQLLTVKSEPRVVFIVDRWHITRPGNQLICRLPWGKSPLLHGQRYAFISQVSGDHICLECHRDLMAKFEMVSGVFEQLRGGLNESY